MPVTTTRRLLLIALPRDVRRPGPGEEGFVFPFDAIRVEFTLQAAA